MDTTFVKSGLPENAFRELKEGESYIPLVSDETGVREVSVRSVLIGMIMTVVFSAAAGFIALKTGQGIETAIPIAIIAVGLSALFGNIFGSKNTILENVNILAIGATASGAIGGTVFTLPAIWILGLEHRTNFFQLFLIALLGTVLGILLLIPFRRYFVAEMHGKFPFPEGTAITNILVAGDKGGSGAKVLLYSLGLGFLYDTCILVFDAWREVVTTAKVGILDVLTKKWKFVASLDAMAAMAGLGMIIGLRYATIILVGSLISWWVLVPLLNIKPELLSFFVSNAPSSLSHMTADEIFGQYVRYIFVI